MANQPISQFVSLTTISPSAYIPIVENSNNYKAALSNMVLSFMAGTTTTETVNFQSPGSSVTIPVTNGTVFENQSYGFATDGINGLNFQVTSGGGTNSLTVRVRNVIGTGPLGVGAIVTLIAVPPSQISFDTVSVGANATTAEVAFNGRIPLTTNVLISSVVVIAETVPASSTFNVVLTDAAKTGTVPAANDIATSGQSLFATDQTLPAAGVLQTYNIAAPAYWPLGSALTLRVASPGGEIDGLKVSLAQG